MTAAVAEAVALVLRAEKELVDALAHEGYTLNEHPSAERKVMAAKLRRAQGYMERARAACDEALKGWGA